jgi:hypothetical protein
LTKLAEVRGVLLGGQGPRVGGHERDDPAAPAGDVAGPAVEGAQPLRHAGVDLGERTPAVGLREGRRQRGDGLGARQLDPEEVDARSRKPTMKMRSRFCGTNDFALITRA